jgi:hypothetical protein
MRRASEDERPLMLCDALGVSQYLSRFCTLGVIQMPSARAMKQRNKFFALTLETQAIYQLK